MRPNRNYITDHIAFENGWNYRVTNGIDSHDDGFYVNERPRCPECGGGLDTKALSGLVEKSSDTDICGQCGTTWQIITIPTYRLVIDV